MQEEKKKNERKGMERIPHARVWGYRSKLESSLVVTSFVSSPSGSTHKDGLIVSATIKEPSIHQRHPYHRIHRRR
jgi:hypothetical protein